MILRMIYFLCIQLVLWTPTWAKADLKQVLEKMDAYIPLALDAWGAPGCAVVIVKDDEVVYIKAFGEKTPR